MVPRKNKERKNHHNLQIIYLKVFFLCERIIILCSLKNVVTKFHGKKLISSFALLTNHCIFGGEGPFWVFAATV